MPQTQVSIISNFNAPKKPCQNPQNRLPTEQISGEKNYKRQGRKGKTPQIHGIARAKKSIMSARVYHKVKQTNRRMPKPLPSRQREAMKNPFPQQILSLRKN